MTHPALILAAVAVLAAIAMLAAALTLLVTARRLARVEAALRPPPPRLFDRILADAFAAASKQWADSYIEELTAGTGEVEPTGILNVPELVSEPAQDRPPPARARAVLPEPLPAARKKPGPKPKAHTSPASTGGRGGSVASDVLTCSGEFKRHSYPSDEVKGTRRCVRCGAREPVAARGERAIVTTAADATAWSGSDSNPADLPDEHPGAVTAPQEASADGTHPWRSFGSINGPSTSKASSSIRRKGDGTLSRSAMRGGATDVTVTGVEREPEATAVQLPPESDGICPKGHGDLIAATDEYGDPDPHCVSCGYRPPPPNAEELVREASTPRTPGLQRRREPSIGGMRI